jgi:hypothetical protein
MLRRSGPFLSLGRAVSWVTVVDASVFALNEYQAAVDAARANALAASATSARASGLTPRLPDDLLPESDNTSSDTSRDLGPYVAMLTDGQRERLADFINSSDYNLQLTETFDAQSDEFFQMRLERGMTWEQARRDAYEFLTIEAGLTPNEAMDLLSPYTAMWESIFKGEEITYDPAAGMGPGMMGPYLPSSGVRAASGSSPDIFSPEPLKKYSDATVQSTPDFTVTPTRIPASSTLIDE